MRSPRMRMYSILYRMITYVLCSTWSDVRLGAAGAGIVQAYIHVILSLL